MKREQMQDFFVEALDQLPHAAFLVEKMSNDIVHLNMPAAMAVELAWGGREAFQELVHQETIYVLTRRLEQRDRTDVIVLMSTIPAKPSYGRPDLILGTVHESVDPATARLDHDRIVLSLQVNESSENAIRIMESSLTQISAALQDARDVRDSYNRSMRSFLLRDVPDRA